LNARTQPDPTGDRAVAKGVGSSRDHWERSLEIERAQFRGFARSIAEVEWLMLLLVMLYLFVTRPPLANQAMVVGALVAFAFAVLVLRYTPQLRHKTQTKISLEILAMVGFLTLILSQAGRETSPLINLYLLPIIAAALALGKRATTLVSLLVCICYFLLATAERGYEALSPALFTQASGVLVPFLLVAFLTTLLAENIQTFKRRIQDLSDRDELTNLLNIRAFMRFARRAHLKATEKDGGYSLLLVDLDHLKQINDRYGHEAGNKALRVVAEALLRVTQSTDLVARFGGDEFIALLANSEVAEATEIAQRVRNVVYSLTLEINVEIVRIQVSVGVASYPVDGSSLERVMAAADKAMYTDKALRAQPGGKLIVQKR
jgi:diguanylate cyclase (GGDEF)-like protein